MSDSPPWMPLNVGDYLKDTGHLTVSEHGAYMLLIMRYWQDAGLPADEKLISRYAHLTAEQWEGSRDVLAALFDEGWKHKRIDAELAKAAEIIGKRKAAADYRHSKSNAHAEQMDSKSTYTGVPPSPLPKPLDNRPSLSEPGEGARDLFDEVWKTFPRNPQSAEGEAFRAWQSFGSADHSGILAAAQRYAAWFAEDCVRRKRSELAGRDFVPKLSTWLGNGAWREAVALPIKSESAAPVVPMMKLDRDRDRPVWLECERIRGKKAPTSNREWAFPTELVEQAKANLSSPIKAA